MDSGPDKMYGVGLGIARIHRYDGAGSWHTMDSGNHADSLAVSVGSDILWVTKPDEIFYIMYLSKLLFL